MNFGEYTVLRFVPSLCLFALALSVLPVSPVHAADAASVNAVLKDDALEENLPDDPAADLPDHGSDPAQADVHASLPPLTVLNGICSVNLQATGLLDHLAPFLAREAGIVIRWRAVDDRRAEALAQAGDGDILLTAMPDKETALVREGRAEQRLEIMRDGYVLAGPAADPADIRGKDIEEALRLIADTGAPFISRGDGSATHKRERALWKKADRAVRDARNGYVESGQGAPSTLAMAENLDAYVLTDMASLLTHQATPGATLTALVDDQPSLGRVWSLLPLTPAATDDTDATARALRTLAVHAVLEWWQTPATRERVARFTREGQAVFTPFPVQTPTVEDQTPSSAS